MLLTADRSQDRRDDAQRLGCRLLHKPVAADKLLLTIMNVLIQEQQQQQLG